MKDTIGKSAIGDGRGQVHRLCLADLLMIRLLYPSLFFLAVHVVFLALVITVVVFN
jgi:hypothetical protein